MRYSTHSLPIAVLGSYLSIVAALLPLCAATTVRASDGDTAIPVELQVELDSQDYLVGENFAFTLRIVNPNSYPIELRRFRFNRDSPRIRIEIVIPGGDEYRPLPPGDHEAIRNSTATIAPHSSVEYGRFFCISFGMGQWRLPTGRYRLRAVAELMVAAVDQMGEGVYVNPTSDDVVFTLHAATGVERKAFEFLQFRWQEREELVRKNPRDRIQQLLRLYEDFLDRFAESAYAPEIRLQLANLLTHELLNSRSLLYKNEHYADLYDECLTFCLDRGGAFAADFIHLRGYADGRHAMDIAARTRTNRDSHLFPAQEVIETGACHEWHCRCFDVPTGGWVVPWAHTDHAVTPLQAIFSSDGGVDLRIRADVNNSSLVFTCCGSPPWL